MLPWPFQDTCGKPPVNVARFVFRSLFRRPTGAPASLGLGTGGVALGLLLAAAAAAPAPAADVNLTSTALDARKAVALPAIQETPAVRAAAGAVLDGGDAQRAFTSSGGSGDLVTATVPAGGALATAKLKAVVFDPRLTAISVVGRDRSVAVAAALDPSFPFVEPVLAGAVVDPGVAGSLAVLFPPRSGTIPQITLQRHRGGQLITIELAATATPGLEGAILVGLEGRDRFTGPQIGYASTYTLRIATGRSFTVKTRPIPTALVKRSFTPGPGFTSSDRKRLLKAVSSIPAVGRKIVDVIGGAVTIRTLKNSAPICRAQTSCAGFDPGNGYFLILNRAQLDSRLGRFVITHEIGHLIDFLGLDSFSYVDLKKLFTRSPKWENCFPLRGSCSPFLELFADQFAFYSTNARGVQSGYGDDRLATATAFATLLQAQWSFRPPTDRNPLAGFGPLAKSFADALHSNEDAL